MNKTSLASQGSAERFDTVKLHHHNGVLYLPVPPWLQDVHELTTKTYEGYTDWHAHDRFNSAYEAAPGIEHIIRRPTYLMSLLEKQDLVDTLHRTPLFTEEAIKSRHRRFLEFKLAHGERKLILWCDIGQFIRLKAIESACRIREEFENRIEVQVAIQPIFGIEPQDRWNLYREAARLDGVSVLGALPERDARPASPGRPAKWLGREGHLRRLFELALELNKPVHIHIGQRADPGQNDLEEALDVLKQYLPLHTVYPGEPDLAQAKVVFIHNISNARKPLVQRQVNHERMREYGAGLIVCPSAAISMVQVDVKVSDGEIGCYNSIARILEPIVLGIPVGVGTDNAGDHVVPQGPGAIIWEAWLLSLATDGRLADERLLAKILSGQPLNNTDRTDAVDCLQRISEARGITTFQPMG